MFWVPRRTPQEWKHTSVKLLAPLWDVYVKQALTRAGENPLTCITPPPGFVIFSESDEEGYSPRVDRSSGPVSRLQCSISHNPSLGLTIRGFSVLLIEYEAPYVRLNKIHTSYGGLFHYWETCVKDAKSYLKCHKECIWPVHVIIQVIVTVSHVLLCNQVLK